MKPSKFSLSTSVLSLVAAAMLCVSPASAQEMVSYDAMPAGVYQIDPTHASLTWKVSHAGLSNYTARFKSFDATVTLGPKDVTKSVIKASVNPASIETDHPKNFNRELQDPKWFNSGTFPKIIFESTRIEKTGDKNGKIHGNLTFLGVTKPIVLDAVFNGAYITQPFSQKPTLGVSAYGTIKRSEWGMDTYVPAIGDDVTLAIEAEFVKQDSDASATGVEKSGIQ